MTQGQTQMAEAKEPSFLDYVEGKLLDISASFSNGLDSIEADFERFLPQKDEVKKTAGQLNSPNGSCQKITSLLELFENHNNRLHDIRIKVSKLI